MPFAMAKQDITAEVGKNSSEREGVLTFERSASCMSGIRRVSHVCLQLSEAIGVNEGFKRHTRSLVSFDMLLARGQH
jgi:hypothetical protein